MHGARLGMEDDIGSGDHYAAENGHHLREPETANVDGRPSHDGA